jgi:hypothetical protein
MVDNESGLKFDLAQRSDRWGVQVSHGRQKLIKFLMKKNFHVIGWMFVFFGGLQFFLLGITDSLYQFLGQDKLTLLLRIFMDFFLIFIGLMFMLKGAIKSLFNCFLP